MRNLSLYSLIPPETLIILVVVGGILWIVQLKKFAKACWLAVGICIIFPLVISAIVPHIQPSLLPLMKIIGVSFIGLAIIGLIFGKEVKDSVIADLLTSLIKWIITFPITVLRKLFTRK